MTSILDLNQDCLIKIFSYLTIYELIDVEDTCDAFKLISEQVYASKKYHSIKFELRYLKIDYLPKILERIGGTLRSLDFSGGYLMSEEIKENLVDGISNHCLNRLSKLRINYVQFDKRLFDKLQSCCFHNLIYLDLSRCAISETSGLHLCSEYVPNLKKLKLSGNPNMSGGFFKEITHIEILDVSYCMELRYFEFSQFLKNCKKLTSLDISASPQLIPDDVNIFQELLIYQPHLEILLMDYIGIERDDNILVKFKHLKNTSFSGRRFGT